MIVTNHISLGWHLAVVKGNKIPPHAIRLKYTDGTAVTDYVPKVFIKRRKTDTDAYKTLAENGGLKKTADVFSIDADANYRKGNYVWYIEVKVNNKWTYTLFGGHFQVALPGSFVGGLHCGAQLITHEVVMVIDQTTGNMTLQNTDMTDLQNTDNTILQNTQ